MLKVATPKKTATKTAIGSGAKVVGQTKAAGPLVTTAVLIKGSTYMHKDPDTREYKEFRAGEPVEVSAKHAAELRELHYETGDGEAVYEKPYFRVRENQPKPAPLQPEGDTDTRPRIRLPG